MFAGGSIVDGDCSSSVLAVDVGVLNVSDVTDACGGSWCANVGIWVRAVFFDVVLHNRMGCIRERRRQVDRIDGGNGCAEEKEKGADAGFGHGKTV